MKLARSFLLTVRYAPHWLAEREAIRGEQKIIALLQARPPGARPLAEEAEIAGYDQANRQRAEEIDGSGTRRLISRAYDIQSRLPAAVALPLRLIWRGFRGAILAVSGARRAPGPPDPRAKPAHAPAAAIPFGDGFAEDVAPPPPIGAVIHVYYPELMGEIRAYLENIPAAVDVYVSTDTEAKRALILQAMSGWTAGAVEVRIAPNRGRDIAPKLITFSDVYDRHPLVLHLHSKKSPHDSFLRLWRYLVFETLLGSPRIVTDILAAFAQTPRLGLVAPQHYFPLKAGVIWGPNLAVAQGLAKRIGLAIDERSPLDFPSGSMFWARSAALKPLLDLNLSAEDFPPETGQEDATLAHAIERLYFYACERAGFSWLRICRPELAHVSDEPLVRIQRNEDLAALLTSIRPLISGG